MSKPPVAVFEELRATFESDVTKDLPWRKDVLLRFVKMLRERHEEWVDALIKDLGGGANRATIEIGQVIEEAEHAIARLDSWAADRPAGLGDPTAEVPLFDRRVVRPTPKGVCLVIGTWNFPINLLFAPFIGMVAAGNCVLLKPSELVPTVSALTERLVHEYLPHASVRVVLGGVPETTAVLTLPFDHICYTGSTQVGKIVMAAAAKNLTPCTLELGGKNPTFVDRSARLKLAAKRTILGKATNSGQWCVDADYVLVDEAVADELAEVIVSVAREMMGTEAEQRGDELHGADRQELWLNRIVSERHAERLKSYLEEDHGGTVLMGGLEHCDVQAKFIPFTVVLNPKLDSQLMKEEIFGPILVLYTVSDVDKAIATMKGVCSTPLALYIYSEDRRYTETVLTRCTSGGVGVNTTCEHMFAHTVPFGGVGQSGYGAYHGRHGFDEFSHHRNIMYHTTALPTMFLPKPAWPTANRFPGWLHPFLIRKYITGFVPVWVTRAAKVGLVAIALGAIAAYLRA